MIDVEDKKPPVIHNQGLIEKGPNLNDSKFMQFEKLRKDSGGPIRDSYNLLSKLNQEDRKDERMNSLQEENEIRILVERNKNSGGAKDSGFQKTGLRALPIKFYMFKQYTDNKKLTLLNSWPTEIKDGDETARREKIEENNKQLQKQQKSMNPLNMLRTLVS